MWPFKRRKKNLIEIDFKKKTITTYDSVSTLEIMETLTRECRMKNIKNPASRELVGEKIVLALDTDWVFTDRTRRSYHKKNKKRYTKIVDFKRHSITECYFTREDYKKSK